MVVIVIVDFYHQHGNNNALILSKKLSFCEFFFFHLHTLVGKQACAPYIYPNMVIFSKSGMGKKNRGIIIIKKIYMKVLTVEMYPVLTD